MHYGLSIQVDWTPEKHDYGPLFRKAKTAAGPRMKRLFTRLHKEFPDIPYEFNGLASAELRVPNEQVLPRIVSWMDKQKEKYQIVIISYWTIDDLARARWLPVTYTCDYVDTVQTGIFQW